MTRERAEWIGEAMRHDGYAALVCRLPEHLVMLTRYQPILGNSFCLVSLKGTNEIEIRLAVPEGEEERIPDGVAAAVETYAEETMARISTTIPSVRPALQSLMAQARLPSGAEIGYEGGRSPVATAYTQVGVPGPTTLDLLRELAPDAHLRDATDTLDALAAVKTAEELDSIRRAESVARKGFEAARQSVREDATEAEVAGATLTGLLQAGYAAGASHVLPHVHVMAGARSYEAFKAYNLTGNSTIRRGDPVSVQMEIALDGYWAELTRAFFAGDVSDQWKRAHAACVAAQDAALATIREGASARDVDSAARSVMRDAGFGPAFKHGLGHGFGFQAINHAAAPVLHPASNDVLRAGMIHNMEPAVYLDGTGGFRLNDNVAVTHDSAELLSRDLPRDLDWLTVSL